MRCCLIFSQRSCARRFCFLQSYATGRRGANYIHTCFYSGLCLKGYLLLDVSIGYFCCLDDVILEGGSLRSGRLGDLLRCSWLAPRTPHSAPSPTMRTKPGFLPSPLSSSSLALFASVPMNSWALSSPRSNI